MKGIKKYLRIFLISVQGSLQYRGSALGSVLLYTLFISTFFFLWRAIYARGASFGYTLPQIVWYMCVAELIIFGGRANVFEKLSDDVKTGDIVYPLVRPASYIAMQAATAIGEAAFTFLTTSITGVALGLLLVGPIPGFRLATFPLILLSMLLGILLTTFISMSLAFSAFKLEENRSLAFLYNKFVFMLGAFIPVEFMPGWLQSIVRFLPFPYVSWVPCRLAVAFSWDFFAWAVPMQALWLLGAVLLVSFIYQKCMRTLQAQGG